MKNLDFFRKRKNDQEQELIKLAGNVETLKKTRVALDEQITAAIDADNLSEVETLTAKETALEIKILAAEKILERKKGTVGLNRQELVESNNAEMKGYQEKCDAAMKTMQKYHRQYLEALIKAGEIAKEANAIRDEYIMLAGGPNGYEADFTFVRGGFREQMSLFDEQTMSEINPDGVIIIRELIN